MFARISTLGTPKRGFARGYWAPERWPHDKVPHDHQRAWATSSIDLTGGEASDYKGFDLLYDGERTLPKVLIADRGYDADRIRQDVEAAGGSSVIPGRQGRTRPIPTDRVDYRLRNRIERTFGRMQNARRMAKRYDETAASYLSFVQITAIRLWTKHFVNET